MKKSGHMVLKGVNLVQNAKIRSNGLERNQLGKLGTQCKKSGHMVLKGVNLVQNAKIKSNGVEKSQLGKLGTKCKNQVIWS